MMNPFRRQQRESLPDPDDVLDDEALSRLVTLASLTRANAAQVEQTAIEIREAVRERAAAGQQRPAD